jgi:hypothetical protein
MLSRQSVARPSHARVYALRIVQPGRTIYTRKARKHIKTGHGTGSYSPDIKPQGSTQRVIVINPKQRGGSIGGVGGLKNNWDCGIITDRESDGARGYTRDIRERIGSRRWYGVDETPVAGGGRGRDRLAVLADRVEVLLAGLAANRQRDNSLRVEILLPDSTPTHLSAPLLHMGQTSPRPALRPSVTCTCSDESTAKSSALRSRSRSRSQSQSQAKRRPAPIRCLSETPLTRWNRRIPPRASPTRTSAQPSR